MAAAAQALFKNNFLNPATETWYDIKKGAMRSFTKDDFTHSIFNTIVCSAPMIAGGGTAGLMNSFLHGIIPRQLPLRKVVSFICTTASVIVGAGVSFFAIKLLAANRITLDNFSGDKVVKLEALTILPIAALSPLYYYFNLYASLSFYPAALSFLAAGAFAGYFGQRSLYVIGAISALSSAIPAAKLASAVWGRGDALDRMENRGFPEE
jgi:hypothetical protein